MDALVSTTGARRRLLAVMAVLAVAGLLQILGANPAVPQSPTLDAYRAPSAPGLDPESDSWRLAPAVELPLTGQQATWPVGGSVSMVQAKALHWNGTLFIRLSWSDDTLDDAVLRPDEFTDAVAVEFPSHAGSSVPAICMGQADNGVNIWQWKAAGLPDGIEDLAPGGYVDRYPSTDELYYPARAARNPVADAPAVQDLVAVGFGTLSPAVDQAVQGVGRWEGRRWSVVFARELTAEADEQVSLGEGVETDVAVAVWDGSRNERDGIKAVSGFATLAVMGAEAPERPWSDATLAIVLLGTVIGTILVGVGLSAIVSRTPRTQPA